MGTDLNRNWAHEWGGQGSSKFPCQEIYAGSGPLSEPETKAVADFLMENASKFRVSEFLGTVVLTIYLEGLYLGEWV